MAKFLEVKNLSVTLGKERVLQDVSFSLEEGRVLAIVGPNGAGKTTLLRVLIEAVPYEGEVIWHKREPVISYVPQRFDFDRTIPNSVKEFFLLHKRNQSFLFPSPEILSEIKHLLVHVNAHQAIDKKIGELSAGQLQRVLIAYALFGNPNLVLFDEPTAGIDIEGQITVYDLLEHLSKEMGLTLVLVSHDLNVVYRFADEVLCLNKKVFCTGAPRQILTPQQMERLYGQATFYIHHH